MSQDVTQGIQNKSLHYLYFSSTSNDIVQFFFRYIIYEKTKIIRFIVIITMSKSINIFISQSSWNFESKLK